MRLRACHRCVELGRPASPYRPATEKYILTRPIRDRDAHLVFCGTPRQRARTPRAARTSAGRSRTRAHAHPARVPCARASGSSPAGPCRQLAVYKQMQRERRGNCLFSISFTVNAQNYALIVGSVLLYAMRTSGLLTACKGPARACLRVSSTWRGKWLSRWCSCSRAWSNPESVVSECTSALKRALCSSLCFRAVGSARFRRHLVSGI